MRIAANKPYIASKHIIHLLDKETNIIWDSTLISLTFPNRHVSILGATNIKSRLANNELKKGTLEYHSLFMDNDVLVYM